MARRKKSRAHSTVCGMNKTEAKAASKKAHKAGRKAHIKRAKGKKKADWCVVKGGKRK